ncbi:putative Type I site-specific deoxyribonuclease [Thauera humireducens]|uniref:restriction endonuclease subunit S n=1 Tax=Thauera humireducens TaxID=1134435 RepID=UPI002467A6DF|nr:restriction endonuclease subunit S [Thauera humireducens]CAH1747343.1 putative Type I site-specific deoxyribonuclease [Thauera humireducens]
MSEPTHSPFSRYQLAELAAPGSDTFVDGPFGSSLKSHEYVDAGVRLIQLQNIGEGEWRDENKKFITARKFKTLERHGAVPGDIAIAKMADPVARACLVPPVSEQFVVVADCIRLRLDESRFDAGYVVRSINSPYTRREAENKAIGSTRVRINLSVLKTVGCLAPALPEQREIARILDTFDTAIHETEAIIAKLRAVKQGLLHDLLTRGIAANGELRPPQSEAPHLYKESPLGWIPKEWGVNQLAELLADVDPAMRSGPFGSALLKQELVDAGVPLLGIDNVHTERFVADYTRFVTPRKFAQLARYAVRPDDLMITIMGTVGRCCLVPEDVGQALSSKHTWTISLNQDAYSPYLAMLQVNYSPWVLGHFARDQQGGTMAAIRSDTLRSTQLPAPPRREQHLMEERLREVGARIDLEIESLAKRHAEKSGLMDDLLTGRVRVTPLLESAAP